MLCLPSLTKKGVSSIKQKKLTPIEPKLGPKIMADIFHFVEKPYNLRNNSIIQRQANRTVYFKTESISSLAPK